MELIKGFAIFAAIVTVLALVWTRLGTWLMNSAPSTAPVSNDVDAFEYNTQEGGKPALFTTAEVRNWKTGASVAAGANPSTYDPYLDHKATAVAAGLAALGVATYGDRDDDQGGGRRGGSDDDDDNEIYDLFTMSHFGDHTHGKF